MISGTNSGKLINSEHNKCGPKRSLTPEHEFFLLLVRLRLGLLEEDLALQSINLSHGLISFIIFSMQFQFGEQELASMKPCQDVSKTVILLHR